MKTKIIFTAIVAIFLSGFAQAQEKNKEEIQTLFTRSGHHISHGGYGAFTIGYSQIGDQDVIQLGGRAGWLIDHHFTIGFTGTAFANSIYIDNVYNNTGYYLVGGYGGFFVEPILAPFFPIHVSFPITFGYGGVAYNDNTWWDYNNNNDNNNNSYSPFDSDGFFVIEPGVEVELNVVKFFRICFGATYRYTQDLNLVNTPKTFLNGFTGNITFKIGKF